MFYSFSFILKFLLKYTKLCSTKFDRGIIICVSTFAPKFDRKSFKINFNDENNLSTDTYSK